MFEAIIYHIKECRDTSCHCKYSNLKNSNKEFEEEDVFRLVDSIFKWALSSKLLQQNLEEFEHLSLKYISYLAKYRNNTSRAYYELKVKINHLYFLLLKATNRKIKLFQYNRYYFLKDQISLSILK